ncbi:hypothetical protein [Nonomuraea sediminis]|uniref:hypothetical protein n=1 Tax=Nonomuraea sediminis TaxID=2835864 RepID=UPI001BDD642C|nr:hypothetical protein [Nonomuraea sediminis]
MEARHRQSWRGTDPSPEDLLRFGAVLGTKLGNRTAVLGVLVMAAGLALLSLSSTGSFLVLAIAQVVLGAGGGLAGVRRSPP